tara:strand:- start:572 stop:853 length:282 start_codon:yes stop_codon:yes gene_type:complete
MALFTEDEAKASTIVRLEKKMSDGVYSSMVIGITDADDNYYDWKDSSIRSNASKNTIKTAVSTYLQANVEKKSKPIVTTYEQLEDKGIGETVG